MSTSTLLASLIVLYTFPLRLSAEVTEPSFVVGDRKFNHVWNTKQNMPAKRSDMSATTVDDAIYLVGGCALDQLWVHDPPYSEYRCGGGVTKAITGSTTRYFPKTNTHDTSLPDAPHPRYRHAAAVVDKRVYLFGGTDGSGNIVPEVDVFSTLTGKWTSLTQNMPNPTTDLSAFVLDGKIYTVGGYDPSWKALNITQIFDPSASDAKLAWQLGPELLQGRGDAVAAVVDNKAYIVGGFHDQNNFQMPVTDLEVLDAGKAAPWAARKGMYIARGDKAAAALNSILHVVGGETKGAEGHSVPLRDVEAYDPIGDTWYFGGEIPTNRFRFAAAAHGDSIFIFGGQGYLVGKYGADDSKHPVLDTVEEYNERVTTGSVSSKAPRPSSSMPLEFMILMLPTLLIQVRR